MSAASEPGTGVPGALPPPSGPRPLVHEEALAQVEDLLRRIATAGAVIAAATYGIAQYTLDQYYGVFGITPTDAGVTQTALVARAATVLAGLVALAAYITVVGNWCGRLLLAITERRRFLGGHRWLLTAPASSALVAGFGVLSAIGFPVVGAFALMTVPAVMLGSSLVDGARLPRRPAWCPLPPHPLVLSAAAAILAITMTASSTVASLADGVIRSGRFPSGASASVLRDALGLTVTPISGRCAWVVARNGDRAWVLDRSQPAPLLRPESVDTLTFAPSEPPQC